MAKMFANDNQTSVSWGGKVFEADEKGVFEVPEEAVTDLMGHGLIPGDLPPAPQQGQLAKPVAQWTNADLLAKAAELKLSLSSEIERPALIQAVAAALKAQA